MFSVAISDFVNYISCDGAVYVRVIKPVVGGVNRDMEGS